MCVDVLDCGRVREALLAGCSHSLSDQDLLAELVGLRGSSQLRAHLGPAGPHGLWRMLPEDFIALEGFGPASSARMLACLEVGRRAAAPRSDSRPVMSTPEDVALFCRPHVRGVDREHFWTLALNTKNRLLRHIPVSVGSLNASIVHPRELFKQAVVMSAASVIVVHNHPSGDPTPSGADIQLTRRIVRAGEVLGIEVLDHVVIGEGGDYASLKDLGLM